MADIECKQNNQQESDTETPALFGRFMMVLSLLTLTSLVGLMMLGKKHLHVFWYPKSYMDTFYVLLYALCLLPFSTLTWYVTEAYLEKRKGHEYKYQLSVKLTMALQKIGSLLFAFACSTSVTALAMFFGRYRSSYRFNPRNDWNEPSSWCSDWCFSLLFGLFVLVSGMCSIFGIKVSRRVKYFFFGEPKWLKRWPWRLFR